MTKEQSKQFPDLQTKFSNSTAQLLKYPQPKILLIDMEEETETLLKAAGYNITVGSFGRQYNVEKEDGFKAVIPNDHLPWNLGEQEIVVIDLSIKNILPKAVGEKYTSNGELDWWASCTRGVIDPRPRSMKKHQDSFDRILKHGGVFVIFAMPRYLQRQKLAYVEEKFASELSIVEDIDCDNWCFLKILSSNFIEIKGDRGQEISVVESLSITSLLKEYSKKAGFHCTLHTPLDNYYYRWTALAKNKYGFPVSGVINPNATLGQVFIFPDLEDKPRFLTRFFNEILPNVSPHLFPFAEGGRWVERTEYELPKVVEFKTEIQRIQEEAQKKVVELEQAIAKERSDMAYLHDLLRQTGDPLVSAVQKTFEVLGFKSVINVDEELEKRGDSRDKCEDLQIRDNSPILLIEVKGISGLPNDEMSLQVFKYITLRMKEEKRIDIKGLSLFNHQKYLPPLSRENQNIFRQEILTNAQEHELGLLTTWDLFRLTRSYLKNGWKHEHIKDLFYQNGRLEIVPTHYEFVGVVERFIIIEGKQIIGIKIENAELILNDRIAFEFPVEFEEQDVKSLQLDNQSVPKAAIGDIAGITTHLTKDRAKIIGIRVFRVK